MPDPLKQVFEAERAPDDEGEGYTLEDAVRVVAEDLLDRHLTLARLREARIAYCLQVGKEPQHGQARESTIDTIAKAVKAPPLWQALTGYDAVVWVNEKAWQLLSQRQREAVVLHELLHLDVNDKGRVVVLKHDVEEFVLVASQYGPWHGGLERFGEQLQLFEGARRRDQVATATD